MTRTPIAIAQTDPMRPANHRLSEAHVALVTPMGPHFVSDSGTAQIQKGGQT